jgi:nucleotide-binding universal stress UspA family protein
MYKKILAAVNEQVNSEVSARYAMHLAGAAGAKLYLCSIAEPGLPDGRFELAKAAARRLELRAQEAGIEAECLFSKGDPARKIGEIVQMGGIDLVFAATRREDVQKRFYAGTTARKLSVNLPCAVALVRVVHLGRIHPKEIFVPLKARLTHISERAYFTAMLARAFDAAVYLFHTTKPIKKFFHGEVPLTPVEWEKKIPADISLFINLLERRGVAHEKGHTTGAEGRSITIEAAVRRSDLIIMGASTRSLVSSLFRGNPVERVLRDTPCNLIILKPGHEDT